MYKIKRFFRKLKRVLSAFRVIWNCEEWDYSFTLELLKWRLNECIKYFENSDLAEGDHKRAQEMRETVKAIEEYFDPHAGLVPFEVDYVLVPTERKTSMMMTINRRTGKPLTEEEEKAYKDYLMGCYKYESEDCWNKVWDLIKQHGQGWWN